MKRRFSIFAALLTCAAVLITSVLVTMMVHNSFQRRMQREVAAEASYLCSGFAQYGEEFLSRIDLKSEHRITLISPDGTVQYDSKGNPDSMGNHLERPEVQAALKNGTGESSRISDTLRYQTYYYAIHMEDGTIFRMATATDSLLAAYDNLFWLVALIVIVACLIAVFVSSWMTRKLVKPLHSIDLDEPEQGSTYEEIVPLLTRIKTQRNQITMQTQELDRQRAQFSTITEHMNEGLLVLDSDGTVLSHNISALRLLAIQTQQPTGMHILSLNRSEQLRDAIQSATKGHSVAQVMKIGGRQCQLYVSPVTVEEELLGIIVILMDVTERQEREKLRREFTANVSHELKTPLTAISGYAEIMMNGVAKPEDVPEFAQSIYEESKRLIALIRDLMFLSRLEEGASPETERVNLVELAQKVADSLSAKANIAHVSLTVTGEAAELSVIPSVLQEMLYNLLDNAIKYNRPDGSASIHVEDKGDAIELRVSDRGIGIPKEEQARVFERFYRVDKSHNKTIDGTGLGLAIVKHGAALHQADVSLQSSEHGTTFTLHFPKHPIS